MKVAIVGSRAFPFLSMVLHRVSQLPPGSVVVSGGARGVDRAAEVAAKNCGFDTLIFLPDWKQYGRAAGYIRNVQIVEASDRVIAFQFKKSRGTQHTIDIARKMGKPVEVVEEV